MLDGLTRLVNLTSACLNQPSVGSGCKVITQDADNLERRRCTGSTTQDSPNQEEESLVVGSVPLNL